MVVFFFLNLKQYFTIKPLGICAILYMFFDRSDTIKFRWNKLDGMDVFIVAQI